MRYFWILGTMIGLAGCASAPKPPPQSHSTATSAPPLIIAAVEATRQVETRYEVRGYRDAADSSVRHDAHAVFRRSRVPLNAPDMLETVSRETFAPASLSPLPANAELAAELAAQRQITAELRAMQAALAETGEQMKAQYAALVRHSTDTLHLRNQLETERSRLRATPTSSTIPVAPSSPPASAPAPVPAASSSPEPKW